MNSPNDHPRSLLACLGDASRFELVCCLIQAERCVSELAVQVGLSQSCTTRHLQVLKREGLVRGERDGKRVVFRLRREEPRVGALLEWALRGADPAVKSSARHGIASKLSPGQVGEKVNGPLPVTPEKYEAGPQAPAMVRPSASTQLERGGAPESSIEMEDSATAEGHAPTAALRRSEQLEDYLL